jgi:hypothetical protein
MTQGETSTTTETTTTASDEGSKPVTHDELASFFNDAIGEALAPFRALLDGGGGKPPEDGTNERTVPMRLRDIEQLAESVVAKAVDKLKLGRPANETGKSEGAGGDTGGSDSGAGDTGGGDSVASQSTDAAATTTTTTATRTESAPIGDAKRLARQEKRWGSA